MTAPLRFRVRLGARTVETGSEVLTIGTLSSSSIVLRDPIASERHCEIAWSRGSFVLADTASATGTYLNGLEVEGAAPLRKDDVVVVGVSRLRVEAVGSSAVPLLELVVEESVFHYVASGAGGAKRDADDWVRWEVGFGKLKGLRLAGWAAAAVALLALAAPWWRPAEEAVLSAGALREGHALLFARDPAAVQAYFARPAHGKREDFPNMLARAESEGCRTCHDAFEGTPLAKCATCHTERVDGRHPFLPNPPEGIVRAGREGVGCVGCHSEHKGPEGANGPDRPGSGAAKETCALCHTDEQIELGKPYFDRRTEEGPPDVQAQYVVGTPEFSHKAHAQRLEDCKNCHEPAGAGSTEFAPIGFAQCMQCHGKGADPTRTAHMIVDVPVHGTRDNDGQLCKGCHEKPREAARKLASVPAETLSFRVARRSHAEFHRPGSRCAECHLDGPPEVAAPEPKTFQHGLHLAALAPKDDQGLDSQVCLDCHGSIQAAGGFVTDRRDLVPDLQQRCESCHQDERKTLPPIAVAKTGAGGTRTRIAFPHEKHGTVEGQCFACHVFEPADDPLRARPITLEKAADCTACHGKDHVRLGKGECAKCHEARNADGVPLVYLPDPPTRTRTKVGDFSHFGEGHAELDCRVCHGGIAQAETVEAIEILSEATTLCSDCHIEKRAMFHFPLRRHTASR